MSPSTTPHPILRTSYADRASTAAHPLTAYLLRLMTLKSSNLCLSADVSTANQLLNLANLIGPHIVVLKTHYDLISNWDYNPQTGTAARLQRIARRHGFLIFEDRKFGDIGNTVQLQYTEGTAKIIEWANITNVNMVPGKAAVDALTEAGRKWRERKRYEVKTDISAGTRRESADSSDAEDSEDEGMNGQNGHNHETPMQDDWSAGLSAGQMRDRDARKASIVSITTVTQQYEPAISPRASEELDGEALVGIEEPPLERGLLILAQMSSKGNFMNKEYTDACVESARENKGFVMGFIAQESLNREKGDQFLCMTPGCQLPPVEDEDAEVEGDGKGQQYNTPHKIIEAMGSDIIIVGRGIIKAGDPQKEAARYRQKGWEAYEARIAS